MKIRSISIDTIEFNGDYACDVNIRFTDNNEMVVPTKLWTSPQKAVMDAKKIRDNLFSMSSDDLDNAFNLYFSKKQNNPFKDILGKINRNYYE